MVVHEAAVAPALARILSKREEADDLQTLTTKLSFNDVSSERDPGIIPVQENLQ